MFIEYSILGAVGVTQMTIVLKDLLLSICLPVDGLCVCTFCMHARFYNKLLGRQGCILENDNQMRTKHFQLKNIDCFMDLHDVFGHGNYERDFSQGCL